MPPPLPRPAPASAAAPAFALVVLLILALQFGPLVGLLGFRLTADPQWALNGVVRDAAVVALLLLGAMALAGASPAPPLPASARWALLMVLVYGVLALRSSSGLVLTALNLRRLALVPLLFAALLAIPWSRPQLERLFALLVASSVAVALLGLAERAAPESLWTGWLDVESYTAANALDRFGSLPYAQSGRFFTWDLEPWTGVPLRRMVSSYLEPTTLAAAMAVLLVLALARRARGHAAAAAVALALLCGLATWSKGFVLFLLALAGWRLLGLPSPRQVWSLAIAASALALWAAATGHLEGPLEHVEGLASSLDYLRAGNWLGEGVGAAGNYTDTDTDFGNESGFGNVVGQVGLAALLPLAWVAALAREVLSAAAARGDSGGPWLAGWLLYWTLSYLLSASSLGVGGNALGFAMLALYLHPAAGRMVR
ncbi:conserved membrane hypothetical protein [Rubrivivax sp. A210]|uniref:hypothetical protein n=1 Tax=Rubrivivax sp. A210 TaxID=2772301 RepID=UPI0019181E6F|nr:hypothetical protein [Rubrivivax sp. A210]CAD5371279.1 conserved membrane hypothetical protein [Rubrivivax sp. A210]